MLQANKMLHMWNEMSNIVFDKKKDITQILIFW